MREESRQNDMFDRAFEKVSSEFIQSATEYQKILVKSALLINGAAAIALLAFVGSVWPTGLGESELSSLILSLRFFVYGVLAAVFSVLFSVATYGLISAIMADFEIKKIFNIVVEDLCLYLFYMSSFFVFVSIILFTIGVGFAIDVFQIHLTPD